MGSSTTSRFSATFEVVTQAQFYDFGIYYNFGVEFGKFYDCEFVCDV